MSSTKIDTAKINEVAGQLGALADRINSVLADNETALSPQAAGSDEVSVRAAATMNEVHTSFRDAAVAGAEELREIAAAVTTVATSLAQADTNQDFHVGGTAKDDAHS